MRRIRKSIGVVFLVVLGLLLLGGGLFGLEVLTRKPLFSLPNGYGTVDVVVRYHDWMRTVKTILTLKHAY